MGWQFRALAFNYGDQTLYWTEAANKKIQVSVSLRCICTKPCFLFLEVTKHKMMLVTSNYTLFADVLRDCEDEGGRGQRF